MTLSFFYLAFFRTMQILRPNRSNDSDLAIEVVMLRHEVAVLGLTSSKKVKGTAGFWC